MKAIKLIISLFVLFLASNLYSQILHITNIEKQDNFISIELNEILEICNLKLSSVNEKYSIIVPKYQSKTSNYNYFSFLDRSFKDKIINSINNNIVEQTDNDTRNDITYKLNKFNIINSNILKATFSIIFNDLFEVNATIMNGKNGLWVQWPSLKQQNNKWKKLFIIKDKKLKDAIEKEIINKYNKDIINGKLTK